MSPHLGHGQRDIVEHVSRNVVAPIKVLQMRPVSRPAKRESCFSCVRILRQQILGLPLHQVQGVRDQGVQVRQVGQVQEQQVDQRAEARQRVHPRLPKKEFVTSIVSHKLHHLQRPALQTKAVRRGVEISVADHSRGEPASRRVLPLLAAERP